MLRNPRNPRRKPTFSTLSTLSPSRWTGRQSVSISQPLSFPPDPCLRSRRSRRSEKGLEIVASRAFDLAATSPTPAATARGPVWARCRRPPLPPFALRASAGEIATTGAGPDPMRGPGRSQPLHPFQEPQRPFEKGVAARVAPRCFWRCSGPELRSVGAVHRPPLPALL